MVSKLWYQTSTMTILSDEEQIVSDNEEIEGRVEEVVEEIIEHNNEANDEGNIDAATENNFENTNEDFSSNLETLQKDEFPEVKAEAENDDLDEDLESKVDVEIVEDDDNIAGVVDNSDSENESDFLAEKALQEALDSDENDNTPEEGVKSTEELVDESTEESAEDESSSEDRVIEDDTDVREDIDEDQAKSESSNSETKPSTTIEDSGRYSFSPTEYS